MDSTDLRVDAGARQRLTARFGSEVEAWFDELPEMLVTLAERWDLEFGAQIPRGSVSVVFRCRMADGRAAVLKASPDRARVAYEAAAARAVADRPHPGGPRARRAARGAADRGDRTRNSARRHLYLPRPGDHRRALEIPARKRRSRPLVPEGCAAGRLSIRLLTKLYERCPQLAEVIPPELYKRGRRLANRLAQHDSPIVLLHGDLTPSNILDGGAERGLVAIDPAPCLGDGAFDAVDLILWQADDLKTIEARTQRLAAAIGADAERLVGWCTAFAGMTALELASQGRRSRPADRGSP